MSDRQDDVDDKQLEGSSLDENVNVVKPTELIKNTENAAPREKERTNTKENV